MIESDLTTFGLGMIGACAPEILRLYNIRHHPEQFSWSKFYLIASFAFALLGGIVALILPATTPWAAFYAGVSAPVLITKGIQRTSSLARPKTKAAAPFAHPKGFFLSFVEGL